MDVNKPGYSSIKHPHEWYTVNRTGLQSWIKNVFNYQKSDIQSSKDTCPLFMHQHIIKDYLQWDSPYRSLILYQGLGTGKTRASIAVAEVLSSYMKILVMLPASLEGNYRLEIARCANNIFKNTGLWKFVPIDAQNFKSTRDIIQAMGVSSTTIKANKGVWTVEKTSTTNNYGLLKSEHQMQINKQVDDMISTRYTFVHYNGLSTASANNLVNDSNQFDNHLVIIDEVHNFISRVVNDSRIMSHVYNAILNCDTCKVLLLSGTPIINKPFELAALCNLARGPMHLIDIQWSVPNDTVDVVAKRLAELEWIDLVDHDASTITIVPLPPGFIRTTDKLIKKCASAPATYKDMLTLTSTILQKENITFSFTKKPKMMQKDIAYISFQQKYLFPTDEKDFEDLFIDYSVFDDEISKGKSPILNPIMLSRRMQGIISYFETYDSAQYPVLNATQIVKVEMPETTFNSYMLKRDDEIKKEQFSKRSRDKYSNNTKKELSTSNVYRCYSRALCNFCFPKGISRPYPSSIRNAMKELDDTDMTDKQKNMLKQLAENDEDDNKKPEVGKRYAEELNNVLEKLYENAAEYLTGKGLAETSPKFAKLIEHLSASEGPCLAYSQFRNVEGHGILALVLKAHGYVEVLVKKNALGEWILDLNIKDMGKPKYIAFNSDKDKNKILLALFNSEFDSLPALIQRQLNDANITTNNHAEFIKLIMITQSGAEGISLKNVRQVHILEPYWNQVRIKQVIGRAVRAGSHLGLPHSERKVNVYMYVMTFSESQKKKQIVKDREQGVTSDEYIVGVAERKSQITDTLLELMKKSAIDCLVHRDGVSGSCLQLPTNFGNPNGVLYSYKGVSNNVNDDTLNKLKVTKETKLKYLKSKNGTLVYNPETNEIYDLEIYKNENRLVVIGYVSIEDGKIKPRIKKTK